MIKDLLSISGRPPEADDRGLPGHWEGDMVHGSRQSFVATRVERSTCFQLLLKLDDKDAGTVVVALNDGVRTLPTQLKRSQTWDRGPEMADHVRFTIATDVRVYFCDPQAPWQRGTNENTNGLLQQYLPKGTDLNAFTQSDLDEIAPKLNTRPRKTLGYRTSKNTTQHLFIPRVNNTRYVCLTSPVNLSPERLTTESKDAVLFPTQSFGTGSNRRSVPKITPT